MGPPAPRSPTREAPQSPRRVALHRCALPLRALRDAGVPVLVVVNPVNVEHLRSLDLDADDRLASGLATIGRVVGDSGARFLDLHAQLPDAAFRDAAGHVGTEAHPGAAEQVAAAIAPAVEALVPRR